MALFGVILIGVKHIFRYFVQFSQESVEAEADEEGDADFRIGVVLIMVGEFDE